MTTQRIEVVEVGPRDGLQNESTLLDTAGKVAYIERLVTAGLRRIEATSFVHPARVPQMSDAEEVMKAVPRRQGVRYGGLVLNRRGFDRALSAGVDEVNVVVLATEAFSQRNQGMTVDEGVQTFVEISGLAHQAGLGVSVTIGAAFGCPFEGEVATEQVVRLVHRCVDSGADEVVLADTIGVGVPADVQRLVSAVREEHGAPLRFHFHNTRNTGYANAWTAVELGAVALDASSGGIGGCPFAPAATGNIATEDLAWMLSRSGVETGVALEELLSASSHIEAKLGRQVPALLGHAGLFPPPDQPLRHPGAG